MKFLIMLMTLSFIGCNSKAKLKVGDCFQNDKGIIYQVVKVGDYSYLAHYYFEDGFQKKLIDVNVPFQTHIRQCDCFNEFNQ
jgi:hypothetical protein